MQPFERLRRRLADNIIARFKQMSCEDGNRVEVVYDHVQ